MKKLDWKKLIDRFLRGTAYFVCFITVWWLVILYLLYVPNIAFSLDELLTDEVWYFKKLMGIIFIVGTFGFFGLAGIAISAIKKVFYPPLASKHEKPQS